jgi:hypothetical protein
MLLAKNFYLLVLLGTVCSLFVVSITNGGLLMAAPAKEKAKANLAGNNEIPPASTTAEGVAKLKVKESKIEYKINITGISAAKGAHIHLGKTNENGEVVVNLLTKNGVKKTPSGMYINGTIKDTNLSGPMKGKSLSDLVSAMDSGDTYVNVHTEKFPNGEIRGQIEVSASNQTSSDNQTVTASNMTS